MDSDKRVPIQTSDGRVFEPLAGKIGEYVLRNRLDSARSRFSRWNGRLIESLREARSECEQLKAYNDSLRKDAERYRWLIANAEEIYFEGKDCGVDIHLDDYYWGAEKVKRVADEQIDAAMSAQEKA